MVKALALGLAFGLVAAGGARAEGKPPHPGPEMPGKGVGPEEEANVLAFLRENAPEMAHHLEGAKRDNPEEFRKRVSELAMMVRTPDMREVFVKNFSADQKVRKAMEGVRRAEGTEKERLSKDLEAALGEQFEAKLAKQELQVKKMTEELGKLKTRIEQRRAKKAELVKRRLAEMTGEGEGWDW
ncbi:hypothetical protein EPO15_16635 [bacterium]|nr:MAG: hypothetical protein EPO15_16635 [bacterium]